jgi:23S rRNA A1618 N6-methylase RlmF
MIQEAKKLGLKTMGCMTESSVGISAMLIYSTIGLCRYGWRFILLKI